MNPDFIDFLRALLAERARFLVVGAHALAMHGVPRATGDIDVWIDRSPANVACVWRAIAEDGAPVEALGVRGADLEATSARPGASEIWEISKLWARNPAPERTRNDNPPNRRGRSRRRATPIRSARQRQH